MGKVNVEIKTENDMFSAIAKLLEDAIGQTASKDEIFTFFKERTSIQLVPKLKEMMTYVFDRVENRQLVRMIIRGPRGGGKTFGIASCIEFPLWYFYDFDCVNMGGSATQAAKAYKAIKELLNIPEVDDQLARTVQRSTEKKNGTWINVLATSSRQVRSPHPGNRNKGGLLFIDEECEIQDATLVDAAKPLVNSANPSVIIRSSTQHKVGDSFEECWDNAQKLGYKRFEFDIFDACQTCKRDCSKSIQTDPTNGCYDAIRKNTYNRDGQLVKKGYCRGRAHHDGNIFDDAADGTITQTYVPEYDWSKIGVDGWVAMDEIFQGYIETDSETFEVEWMGKTKTKKGKIYDPYLIDEAEIDGVNITRNTFRRCAKSIGIDWGFAGMCVVTYYFVYGKNIYLYWIDTYKHVGMDDTIGDIYNRQKLDNHEVVLADSEGAYENEALSKYITVHSVAFGFWKDFGISNVRNLLEKKILKVCKFWDGKKNPGFDVWDQQMRGYRFGDNGKPMKKNDHAPDSTMCGLLKWAPKRRKNRSGDILDEPKIHAVN